MPIVRSARSLFYYELFTHIIMDFFFLSPSQL
jgi:hypothetical protein